MQASNLADSLKRQRQDELSHLTQVAMSIAREEYDASVRNHSASELARKNAADRISKLRYGNGDYFWINDLGPRMIMHAAKPELNGQDLSDIKDPNGKRLFVEFVNVVKSKGSGFVEYQWPKPGKEAPQPKLSYVAGFEPWGWIIGTGVYVDDLQAQLWESARNVIIAALVVIGLLGAITLLIARRMSSALVRMTSSVTELGEGNFGIELPGLDRGDELGDMARSIEQFRIKAAEKARNEANQEEERRQVAEQAKGKALQEMAETVERETNAAVGEVANGTERMARNAVSMTDSALLLGKNSSNVAAAAEEALANAQTVAKASSQLSASIAEIASQVKSSRALTTRGRYGLDPGAVNHRQAIRGRRQGWRSDQPDQRDRQPDQPARPQRDHRGRTRRPGRTRLCRSGRRGQIARGANRQGYQRNRSTDHRNSGRDAGIGGLDRQHW